MKKEDSISVSRLYVFKYNFASGYDIALLAYNLQKYLN